MRLPPPSMSSIVLEKLGLDRTLLPLLRWTQRKLVRYTTVPAEAEKIAFDRDQPVCYALHVRQLSSLLVLEEAAEQLGLPRPLAAAGGRRSGRAQLLLLPHPQRPAVAAATQSLRVFAAPAAARGRGARRPDARAPDRSGEHLLGPGAAEAGVDPARSVRRHLGRPGHVQATGAGGPARPRHAAEVRRADQPAHGDGGGHGRGPGRAHQPATRGTAAARRVSPRARIGGRPQPVAPPDPAQRGDRQRGGTARDRSGSASARASASTRRNCRRGASPTASHRTTPIPSSAPWTSP